MILTEETTYQKYSTYDIVFFFKYVDFEITVYIFDATVIHVRECR